MCKRDADEMEALRLAPCKRDAAQMEALRLASRASVMPTRWLP